MELRFHLVTCVEGPCRMECPFFHCRRRASIFANSASICGNKITKDRWRCVKMKRQFVLFVNCLSSCFNGTCISSLFLCNRMFFPFFAGREGTIRSDTSNFGFNFLPSKNYGPMTFYFIVKRSGVLSTFLFS